jgi:hypothetical protein
VGSACGGSPGPGPSLGGSFHGPRECGAWSSPSPRGRPWSTCTATAPVSPGRRGGPPDSVDPPDPGTFHTTVARLARALFDRVASDHIVAEADARGRATLRRPRHPGRLMFPTASTTPVNPGRRRRHRGSCSSGRTGAEARQRPSFPRLRTWPSISSAPRPAFRRRSLVAASSRGRLERRAGRGHAEDLVHPRWGRPGLVLQAKWRDSHGGAGPRASGSPGRWLRGRPDTQSPFPRPSRPPRGPALAAQEARGARARRELTWERAAEAVEDVYHSVLEARRVGAR